MSMSIPHPPTGLVSSLIARAFIAGTAVVWLLAGTAAYAQGSGQEASSTPLDDLLNARISAAAKYEQPVRDVPASVTIITAEEIERYGFESVGEALASIRGLYVTYDRNYTGLGIRGFSRLTDYNDRLQILIDGHPLNEPTQGSVPIGTDLVIDIGGIERIEFVRGPSSVVYGSGAMFGVVNIVMKQSDGTHAASVEAHAGTSGFRSASASTTTAIGGTNIAISGLWRDVGGRNLYFPEFATNGSDGMTRGHDYDDSAGVVARISRGGFGATLHYGTRTKGVPGASYDTNFNQDEWTVDRHVFADFTYDHKVTPRLTTAYRAYWDHYDYRGRYPEAQILMDSEHGERLGFEARLNWDVRSNDRLTFGTDVLDAVRAEYRYWGYGEGLVRGPFRTVAGYVQNEYQPLSNLSITAGVRVEYHSKVGTWYNPRLAAVFNPTASSTLKVLYGQAFRAPNPYELEVEDTGDGFQRKSQGLTPEKVRTMELVYEQRLNPSFAVFASLYVNKASDLIEIAPLGDSHGQYQNDDNALHAKGAELQLDYRSPSGMWAYASWARVHTTDSDPADLITNVPQNLLRLGVSTNPYARLHAGVDLNYESSRLTLDGTRTSAFVVVNTTSSFALTRHLRTGLTIRNLLDRRYATPVGPEFRSSSMLQDGRTVEVMLRVK